MDKKAGAKMALVMCVFAMAVMTIVVYADTGTTGATLTVSDQAPTIESVTGPGTVTLSAGTSVNTYTAINISDPNGFNDINLSSVSVTYSKVGETSRLNELPCENLSSVGNWIFINCTVPMYYYDGAGTWDIDVSVVDNAGNDPTDSTQTLTVNSLDSIALTIATIAFGTAAPGTSDVAGTDLGINNTGNNDYTTIQLTGYNMTSGANTLGVSNFCANDIDDANTGCDALSHGVAQTITGATLSAAESAQEILYSFADIPGGQLAGSYTASSDWVVTTS
jgi:hypothetical protein